LIKSQVVAKTSEGELAAASFPPPSSKGAEKFATPTSSTKKKLKNLLTKKRDKRNTNLAYGSLTIEQHME